MEKNTVHLPYRQVMESYYRVRQEVLESIPEAALKKHRDRNKLLARERISLLLDAGSPFIELSLFAAYGMYHQQFPYAGIVTGIGWVHGHPVMLIANEGAVKGGTYIRETIRKHIRALEMALALRLPVVSLADSGGIFLPEQARVFPDRFDFGRIFYLQAKLSAAGIAQIAVALGMCTAGGAYVPAMADENIIVEGNGTIFLAGPPLVKAATGEEIDAEALGGARVHAGQSGVADHLATDEYAAMRKCRDILLTTVDAPASLPVFPPSSEAIYPYLSGQNPLLHDMDGVVTCLCDGARDSYEFKPDFGRNILTRFDTIGGFKVGVIANRGYLDIDAARKASHFIELCTQRSVPLLFIHNINGFVVGSQHEHNAIASAGARLIHLVANCPVPRITLIAGGSFGAGNYAMAGRAYEPDFLFLWPGAKVGVMGGRQASEVLESVGKQSKTNGAPDYTQLIEEESADMYGSARCWDDGIIDPGETRALLSACLSLVGRRNSTTGAVGVLRM